MIDFNLLTSSPLVYDVILGTKLMNNTRMINHWANNQLEIITLITYPKTRLEKYKVTS